MKRIIITSSIIGLISLHMHINGMQPQAQTQAAWIRPAVVGAVCLGGLGNAGFFWNKNRKLIKPKQPNPPTNDTPEIERADKNIQCLQQIQQQGKKYSNDHDSNSQQLQQDRQNLREKFKELSIDDDEQTKNLNWYLKEVPYPKYSKDNHRWLLYWNQYWTERLLAQAFNNTLNPSEFVLHTEGEKNGVKQSMELAKIISDNLERQKQKKTTLEQQQKEKKETYERNQTAYAQQNKQYDLQLAKNKNRVKWGLSIAGIGGLGLLWCLGNKK